MPGRTLSPRGGRSSGSPTSWGLHPEALRNWVRQGEVDGGVRAGTTTDDGRRLAELEREVRELRRANEPDSEDVRSVFRGSAARPQDPLAREVPVAVVVEYIDAHRGYVDWYNHRRLHGEPGLIPPVELEANPGLATPPSITLTTPSPSGPEPTNLHETRCDSLGRLANT